MLAVVALAVAIVAAAVGVYALSRSGSSGSSGAAPTETLWAVVAGDGSLARGAGVVWNNTSATGVYGVGFDQILYGCTFSATLGTTSYGHLAPGDSVSVAVMTNNSSALRVFVVNSTTQAGVASSFHVVASCPAGLYAVVGGDGRFESGAQVASTARLALGTYQVVFNTDVSGCAYIASLGTGHGASPAGSLTTASRSGVPNGVYVKTFNSSGVDTDETFNVQVYC